MLKVQDLHIQIGDGKDWAEWVLQYQPIIGRETKKSNHPYFSVKRYGSEAVYKIWIESDELKSYSQELGGSMYKPLYGGDDDFKISAF